MTTLSNEYNAFLALSRSAVPFHILDKKIKGIAPVRARFAYYLYRYVQAEQPPSNKVFNAFFEQQFPFILEVIIAVQYYHNQILDGKGGVSTLAKVNDNVLLANLLKDQLYKYLEYIKLDYPTREKLVHCVRSIFEYVDMGQYMEKHCGTYQALQTGNLSHSFEKAVADFVEEACLEEVTRIIKSVYPIPEKHQPFLRCYLQRIYLTNAALFKIASTFIVELLEIEEAEARRIVRFSTLFGIAQQVMNDNCDLVPASFGETTVEKICGDAFSDVRNGTVTLPILIYLTKSEDGKMAAFLAHNKMFTDEIAETDFFEELTSSLSIYYALSCGKNIKKQALKCLNSENEIYRSLKDLCGPFSNNRFYKYYYAEKIYYQRYRKVKKTTSINHDTDRNNSNNGGFL